MKNEKENKRKKEAQEEQKEEIRRRISSLVSANPNMHKISGAQRDRKTLTHFHPIDPLSGRDELARQVREGGQSKRDSQRIISWFSC